MSDYFHELMVAKMIAGNDYLQGYSVGFNSGYKQGKEDAIDEFVNKMKKYYWDRDIQSVKYDPCVIDAMIDLAIRTAKEVKGA